MGELYTLCCVLLWLLERGALHLIVAIKGWSQCLHPRLIRARRLFFLPKDNYSNKNLAIEMFCKKKLSPPPGQMARVIFAFLGRWGQR